MNLSSNSIASHKQTHVYEREMDIKSRIEKIYGKSSSRFLWCRIEIRTRRLALGRYVSGGEGAESEGPPFQDYGCM